MNEDSDIPLFPLNVVLFPQSKIPLFIFEERYKKLIKDSIETESEFGIILFSGHKIHTTGCTAKVIALLNENENGEMNIVTEGYERFELLSYKAGTEGFFIGKVRILEDDYTEYDKDVLSECLKIYNEFVEIVYKGRIEKINQNDIKWKKQIRSFAFVMAEKSGMSLEDRQRLLESNNENDRLGIILSYFKKVYPKLKETERISDIIKSDGYIQ
ncbi:MAG: LON peptidase substrate-binding domain-containing protein [Ignavibacteria bacterium]|nr:LON peptidase substrate-binding domain-containing protein [Ignavibacteria bacterium]